MSIEAGLLSAIVADPGDDASRLVYADWLDDHGRAEPDRARAAFIRLQVEAARLDEYDPRRLDLEGQAEALLNAQREHGEPRAWLAGVEDMGVNHHYSSFERGFPTVVSGTVNEILDWGDALWAAAPFCRLGLSPNWQPGGEDRFPALARWPHLAHLRTLRLWGVPSSVEALAPLLASPWRRSATPT